MIRYPESRAERRRAAKIADEQRAVDRKAAKLERKAREGLGARGDDRRQAERRTERTPAETARFLEQLGVEDRRRAQRRRGGDRRHG